MAGMAGCDVPVRRAWSSRPRAMTDTPMAVRSRRGITSS